jgi:hypothetical protein
MVLQGCQLNFNSEVMVQMHATAILWMQRSCVAQLIKVKQVKDHSNQ